MSARDREMRRQAGDEREERERRVVPDRAASERDDARGIVREGIVELEGDDLLHRRDERQDVHERRHRRADLHQQQRHEHEQPARAPRPRRPAGHGRRGPPCRDATRPSVAHDHEPTSRTAQDVRPIEPRRSEDEQRQVGDRPEHDDRRRAPPRTASRSGVRRRSQPATATTRWPEHASTRSSSAGIVCAGRRRAPRSRRPPRSSG